MGGRTGGRTGGREDGRKERRMEERKEDRKSCNPIKQEIILEGKRYVEFMQM
ncbi:MAG: hypothetical protein LBF40_08850 [Deltaproteobacteria bacterium]|nr:hypothetical protein [Deltaproteobacteria bacterium]